MENAERKTDVKIHSNNMYVKAIENHVNHSHINFYAAPHHPAETQSPPFPNPA